MSSTTRSTIAARPPFLRQLQFFCLIWTIKSIVRLYIWSLHIRRGYLTRANAPTYTKTYAALPSIPARIFIPSSYKPGGPALPLFIDIHGGGFAIGAPILDDPDNTELAEAHGLCVVSVGYRLAPAHPFPTGVHDCAAMIRAVLDDADLPADRTRVAVGGYSAGGNMALAATQLDGLPEAVKGVVGFYPAVDFTRSGPEKVAMATPPPGGKRDMLEGSVGMINWAYVSPGMDKRDPLMSPHFAERGRLPKKVYLLGCEYDMLGPEAKSMAEKLAEEEGEGEKVMDGDGEGWTTRNVRWRRIMGAEHGFNQQPKTYHGGGTMGTVEERGKKAMKDMHADVARWLKKEVYA